MLVSDIIDLFSDVNQMIEILDSEGSRLYCGTLSGGLTWELTELEVDYMDICSDVLTIHTK